MSSTGHSDGSILFDAFTTFTRIEVEPLDTSDLRKKEQKTSRWWRRLLSKLRREKQPAWRLWRYVLSELWKISECDFLQAKASS